MRASRRALAVAIACLLNFCLWNLTMSRSAAAQQSDQVVAERILGPQWKQLSRRAGMIFAGTVLSTAPKATNTQPVAVGRPSGATPAIELRFRIDEAIAGVDPGQVLTIHEWTGAWSMHRPMSQGQHILIFLYAPSRLGLTSPVGGPLGQVALDSTGKTVSQDFPELGVRKPDAKNPPAAVGTRSTSSRPLTPVDNASVSVLHWSGPSAAPGVKRSDHAEANPAGCRFSDLRCRRQPRRRPGFRCRLRLQPRSGRPAADLGERLGRVLHQPGGTQSDPDRSASRRPCCLRFQYLDEYSRSCAHGNAGRSPCRVRGRRGYRNQRLRSCYRPGGHYAFRHRHTGWNRL
jgi:hypothetical protein